MNCPSKTRNGRLRLIEFAAARAGAMERMELQFHAESCQDCQSVITEQRQLFSALDDWEGITPRREFNRTLYARLEEEANRNWLHRFWRSLDHPMWVSRPSIPLGIAALVVVGFVAGDGSRWMGKWHHAASAPAVSPAIAQDPTEQINQAMKDLQLLDQMYPVKHRAHRGRTRPL